MKFGILGPLLMEGADRASVPRAPKQRQLLALLLLNANEVVSTDACIEELWDERPPRSARSTLQTYVLLLRRALRRATPHPNTGVARQKLETRERGYLLNVDTGELDLDEFECRVLSGRAALARGDDAEASAQLRAALGMWRGEPLADIFAGPILRAHLVRLEEHRFDIREECVEADLRLGRHHELLSELRGLVARHPANENLAAQMMLALYRSGRQAQALETFADLRRVLDEELGLEPSPRMRLLHQAVLTYDARLDPPVSAAVPLSLDLADALR
ncbi:AfsR/SARP family transcriptional regulator [Yinghuangia sp. ASG 101]|uniref:AfsR/SARP family transcriptional regulator n=1 Tax=Yinghuangia sp. ASG 101 TaxID=2896848 RepID=UPI001E55BF0A|nr:AfsR/SARP family transcriptional regulator [Yinghuangia sp. ASG 101]UGQ11792.1 AfsR/SARP family transcriptional regulator [Yinghuangia sp. ASG 101]